MVERCPSCGRERLTGSLTENDAEYGKCGAHLHPVWAEMCAERETVYLRAKIAKLEAERDAMAKALRHADRVVAISDRGHEAWNDYKAAKAELEKLRAQGDEA